MTPSSELARWRLPVVFALAAAAGFFWFGLFDRGEARRIPPSAFGVRVRLKSLEAERPRELVLRSSGGFDLELEMPEGRSKESFARAELVLRTSSRGSGADPLLAITMPDGRRAPRIELRPRDGAGEIELSGRRYAGMLSIDIAGGFVDGVDQTYLRATNALGIEHYLAGVVGPEISPHAAMAALEAQAIAARTYALFRMSRSGIVFDTASSQVYQGMGALEERVLVALQRTAGEILSMDGEKPIAAFYHSTCGGHTARGADVFPYEADALPGVASPDCEGTPHYRWSYAMTQEQSGRIVADLRIGRRLIGLQAERRDAASGRWIALRVRGDEGESVLEWRDWKNACDRAGAAVPKDSLWHDVSLVDGALAINGGGYGHGVGMCQMCARRMGQRGARAEEILARFYPGARIHRLRAEAQP